MFLCIYKIMVIGLETRTKYVLEFVGILSNIMNDDCYFYEKDKLLKFKIFN